MYKNKQTKYIDIISFLPLYPVFLPHPPCSPIYILQSCSSFLKPGQL